MRQKNVKMAICAVTAILTFSSMDIKSNAATDLSSVLPSAGVDYTLQANATSLKNIKEEADTEKASSKQETAGQATGDEETEAKADSVSDNASLTGNDISGQLQSAEMVSEQQIQEEEKGEQE